MPNQVKIAAAAISLIVAHEMGARRFRKRANANRDTALLLIEEMATMRKKFEYLAHMIDESDIEFDEFDVIMLSNM